MCVAMVFSQSVIQVGKVRDASYGIWTYDSISFDAAFTRLYGSYTPKDESSYPFVDPLSSLSIDGVDLRILWTDFPTSTWNWVKREIGIKHPLEIWFEPITSERIMKIVFKEQENINCLSRPISLKLSPLSLCERNEEYMTLLDSAKWDTLEIQIKRIMRAMLHGSHPSDIPWQALEGTLLSHLNLRHGSTILEFLKQSEVWKESLEVFAVLWETYEALTKSPACSDRLLEISRKFDQHSDIRLSPLAFKVLEVIQNETSDDFLQTNVNHRLISMAYQKYGADTLQLLEYLKTMNTYTWFNSSWHPNCIGQEGLELIKICDGKPQWADFYMYGLQKQALKALHLGDYQTALGYYLRADEIISGIVTDTVKSEVYSQTITSEYGTIRGERKVFYRQIYPLASCYYHLGDVKQAHLLVPQHKLYRLAVGDTLSVVNECDSIFHSQLDRFLESLLPSFPNKKNYYAITEIFFAWALNDFHNAALLTKAPLMISDALTASMNHKSVRLLTVQGIERSIKSSQDSIILSLTDSLNQCNVNIVASTDEEERLLLNRQLSQTELKRYNRAHELGLLKQLSLITPADIQGVLSNGEVALEFVTFNDWDSNKEMCGSYILQNDTIQFVYCGKSEDLKRNPTQIWDSLGTYVSEAQRIYFTPAGFLHQTPIETMTQIWEQQGKDEPQFFRLSSMRQLLEPYCYSIKSSSLFGGLQYEMDPDQLLAEAQESNFSGMRSMGLRELRYGVESLKYSEPEVKDIAGMLEKEGILTRMYLGTHGTEEAFRALSGTSCDILHLSTHGFFFSPEQAQEHSYVGFLNDPKAKKASTEDWSMLRSGLVLSGANTALAGEELPADVEDGIVTAQELATLDFSHTDLVVLSACETGLGEVSAEGVFGLQRGFKLAGAKSLLMSLWKVNDQATQVLMTEFYRHLLEGKTKVESLRLAQKHVKDLLVELI